MTSIPPSSILSGVTEHRDRDEERGDSNASSIKVGLEGIGVAASLRTVRIGEQTSSS